ncbi:MAG: energy-coupling factor transporter transmembrane protein EcfT [Treponema sp.]|nr:energy-coupling factor transporter transmembrane protein EcfT [Treponema sp.]
MKTDRPDPWSYRKGATLLHRLPAGLKLSFLLLLSLAAFFPGDEARSVTVLAAITLALVLLSFAAGIGPRALLRGSGPLVLFIAAIALVRGVELSPVGFNTEGLRESGIFAIRICAAFAAGSLLFAVTTPGELRKSLSRVESALRMEKLKLGMGISLMLGFLPRFFETWEDATLAWKSRGGKKNLSRLVILIPLAVEKMMLKAAETAQAMECRGGEF